MTSKLRVIVDAQLPRALCLGLAREGLEAIHVKDVLKPDARDSDIWEWALENNASILTKDEDFSRRAMAARRSPCVIWVRIGNCTNAVLWTVLQPHLARIVEALEAGERVLELS